MLATSLDRRRILRKRPCQLNVIQEGGGPLDIFLRVRSEDHLVNGARNDPELR
jgi:hypothetical protein